MPIGKIEAVDETNDDWDAYVERVEQFFSANDVKSEKTSGCDFERHWKQNVWMTAKFVCLE